MQEFGVSRGTLRQAIDALERQGLVHRQQGRGTFVRRTPVAAGMMDFFHFLEDLRQRGFSIELQLIRRGVSPATGPVAKLLELPEGTPLVVIRRLVLLDGEPFQLDDYHVEQARFGGLLEDDVEHHYIASLLEERYGVRLTKQQKWLEPVVVQGEEAQLLGVQTGDPALLIESLAYGVRSTRDQSNADTAAPGAAEAPSQPEAPVEFRRMYMRGDKCRFFVEIERA